MRVVFMGTPAFAVPALDALVGAGHEVVLVVTREDKPRGRSKALVAPDVKVRALELGLPVFQPRTVREPASWERIAVPRPEALVVVAYGRILPQQILDAAPLGAINVHASLLPHLRGAAPINWAIARGDRETGVSIMQIDLGLDTGDVWARRATPIGERETAPALAARLAVMGGELLVETLPGIAGGTLARHPQDHARATLAPILKKEDGRIDWSMPASLIDARIRAFDPWPGCHARMGSTDVRVVSARPAAESTGAAPGTVVAAGTTLAIACGGSSVLEIIDVAPAGRRLMSARDFLNGARPADRLREGDVLSDRVEEPTADGDLPGAPP